MYNFLNNLKTMALVYSSAKKDKGYLQISTGRR